MPSPLPACPACAKKFPVLPAQCDRCGASLVKVSAITHCTEHYLHAGMSALAQGDPAVAADASERAWRLRKNRQACTIGGLAAFMERDLEGIRRWQKRERLCSH